MRIRITWVYILKTKHLIIKGYSAYFAGNFMHKKKSSRGIQTPCVHIPMSINIEVSSNCNDKQKISFKM